MRISSWLKLGLGRSGGLRRGLQLALGDDEVERRRDCGHLIGVVGVSSGSGSEIGLGLGLGLGLG